MVRLEPVAGRHHYNMAAWRAAAALLWLALVGGRVGLARGACTNLLEKDADGYCFCDEDKHCQKDFKDDDACGVRITGAGDLPRIYRSAWKLAACPGCRCIG